ncbi:FxSxx-COOH system tetratricopeptide repeat protein [Spirillospora sp. NPDC127200]
MPDQFGPAAPPPGEEAPGAAAPNIGTANEMSGGSAGVVFQLRDISGDVHVHPQSPQPSQASGRLVYLPHHVGDMFVGRDDELRRLDEVFTASASAVVGQAVGAVHGLGGVGKSTLAAQWAAARLDEHRLTWWITAETPEGLAEGLAGLGAALHPALAGEPLERLAGHALAWLSAHERWLLVLDNVTRPADLEPVLARLRRPGPAGRILITTRLATGWGPTTDQVIALDVLPPDRAVELLARTVARERPGADLDGARELCEELGRLPLAIEQAAGYLAETGRSPRHYLTMLADYPAALYAQPPAGGELDRTVARVWHATLDQLAVEAPQAGPILRVLAWYAPDRVPRALLDPLPALLGDPSGPPGVDVAVGRLAAYNMITLERDGTVSVHRLVQAVTRTPDPNDPHRHPDVIAASLRHAVTLLDQVASPDPNDPAHWDRWRSLAPHVTGLAEHAPDDLRLADFGRLLDRTGRFLREQGAVVQAAACHARARRIHLDVYGPDHPAAMASAYLLAFAYRQQGRLREAIEMSERTLADQRRVLGADHPDTLRTANSLANCHRDAGNLPGAIELYEEVLERRRRVLGTDHPDTLQSWSNLAFAFRLSGKVDLAISMYEQSLADRTRVLGKDHPDTFQSRNNLAFAYRLTGRLDRAIELHRQNLADRQRILGMDHPSTFVSRGNLASTYAAANDPAKAIELHSQNVADRTRVLGADSPRTLFSRSNLAASYLTLGETAKAIELSGQVLEARRRVLGEDHPQTLYSRRKLAEAHLAAGERERAVALYETALAEHERVLGTEHPHTRKVRAALEGIRG